MTWLDWLQWVLSTLLPGILGVGLWLALIEIRGLRERATASERAVRQIADAIRYGADRIQNRKGKTDD